MGGADEGGGAKMLRWVVFRSGGVGNEGEDQVVEGEMVHNAESAAGTRSVVK